MNRSAQALIWNCRRDQITLREDPNFVMDLDMPDFSGGHFMLNLAGSPHDSGFLSPHSPELAGVVSEHDDTSVHGLIIPPSASSMSGDPFNLGFGGASVSGSHDRGVSQVPSDALHPAGLDEGLLDDPGFSFDAEGNLMEGFPEERASMQRSVQTPARGARHGSLRHIETSTHQLPSHRKSMDVS